MISKKKKICFVVTAPITAIAFLQKHFEILATDFDIYLVANFEAHNNTFDFKYVKEIKSIKIQRGIAFFDDINAIVKLKKYFKNNSFDVVHSITPKAGLISMVSSKIASVKIRVHIFTGQVWHTKKGLFKFILKTIDKLIVFCATDILVDGESQRNFLIENDIISHKNSQVLGKGSISGVDTDKFVPNRNLYNHYRKDNGITNEVVFMFLGRMNHDKGILDLVAAFEKLNEKNPSAKLVLVGPDEENITEKIKNISSNTNIILFGPTSKAHEVLQMADVFCLPSYREGFGTSVIEASLLQKPVICSDTYGLMETIIDGQTGLRHKVADVNSILIQMEKLTNPYLRTELGENGRNYVLQNFSADIISKKWLEFYQKKLS